MEKYMVVVNGKPTGPYSLAELIKLSIKPDTFVRKPGMDDFKEAHELAELRELLGFSYQQTAPQYFASFDQRLLALAIDYFLILIVYAFVALVAYFLIDSKAQKLLVVLSLLVLVPVAKLAYNIIAESTAAQGTVGKKLMNIRVGDMMGNQLSLQQSLTRNLAKILSVLTLFFGYFYLFLNKKHQCLHDLIAGTTVVKDRLV